MDDHQIVTIRRVDVQDLKQCAQEFAKDELHVSDVVISDKPGWQAPAVKITAFAAAKIWCARRGLECVSADIEQFDDSSALVYTYEAAPEKGSQECATQ